MCVFVSLGNGEVVAGTGEQCPPFDEARCGDGRKATEAQLLGPKGQERERERLCCQKYVLSFYYLQTRRKRSYSKVRDCAQ